MNQIRDIRLIRNLRKLLDFIRSKSPRNYEIVVSIIIGIVAGLVAVVLKVLVNTVRNWMYGGDPSSERLLFVVFPLVGIILTLIVMKYVIRKNVSTGLTDLIYAISHKRVNLPVFESYAHVIGSSLTVGLGGSVGLEAPIIRTGSAIGSNLARILRLGRKRQTLFLACGAAAGMSAIFNSPVAGVVFAFEVLLTNFALHSFIPLLISAATGTLVARLLYYEKLLFLSSEGWDISSVPYFIILGIICGLLSAYIIRTTLYLQSYFSKFKQKHWQILAGGLAIGVLIFFMPPLWGEGYDTVNNLFAGNLAALVDNSLFYRFASNQWFLIGFAFVIIMSKALASGVTIAIGGNGGIFAPSMFSGAAIGFLFAYVLNLTGIADLSTANFTAVAMAGLLSGVFKSPLTGIFLIAEITEGYTLFIPLMIVSALSYFVAAYFEPFSVFTKDLYSKGLWVPVHERDRAVLQNLKTSDLVERNFSSLHPEMTLGQLANVIAHSKRNVFPVLETDESLVGIIVLDDVRRDMFKADLQESKKVRDYMYFPPAIVDIRDPMELVMKKFEEMDAWNLPVIEDGRYIGFVSKSSIFNQYRDLLMKGSEEV